MIESFEWMNLDSVEPSLGISAQARRLNYELLLRVSSVLVVNSSSVFILCRWALADD